jgi:hypothetical protein
MNVEIGAEAAQFPEKEYKNGVAVAVLVILIYCTMHTIDSANNSVRVAGC